MDIVENWRPIAGYLSYEVSDRGNVRRIGRRQLKPIKTKDGYLVVSLCESGASKIKQIHRLVADAFVAQVDGLEVNHKNNVRDCNDASNLEVVAKHENISHALFQGRLAKKLSAEDAIKIKWLRNTGMLHKEIASIFGISKAYCSVICSGKTWGWTQA